MKIIDGFTNTTLVDQADVPIIKVCFGGLMADVSINQLGGLCTLDLMDYLDTKVIG